MADSHKQLLRDRLTIIVLGRSGCGKGTQAQQVIRRLGQTQTRYIETGRFLRALIRRSNPTLDLIREVLRKGNLTPGWTAAYLWLKELIEKGQAGRHLVFDGAPRRLWEAELLDEVMAWHGRPLPVCVYLEVAAAEVTRRLLARGRFDDNRRAIQNRLTYFARSVQPVLHYYARHGRLLRVNGNPPPEMVWRSLDQALAKRLGKRWPG